MDRIIEQKPWYFRYKYYIMCGIGILALIIYALSLSMGPSRLRVDEDDVKISEARTAPFLEYVDVEGLVQPIRTLLTSGMRHPKYFFRSKSGLMTLCSGVRKSVWV